MTVPRAMPASTATDLEVFESNRPLLMTHAYRMLGDLSRAEDIVQEAWLRWNGRHVQVDSPPAYLVTTVTRLCFNELGSARARHEMSRGDLLPEPVNVDQSGIGRLEKLEQVSMAFLVVLQRLTPAERAALLLRDVFDFDYEEIASLLGRSVGACRKLLERARHHVAHEKRLFSAPAETHRRLLTAFVGAASQGDVDALVSMLAEDALLVTDGGEEGRRVAGIRNLQVPLEGASNIAAFIVATAGRIDLHPAMHELNGRPALVFYQDETPFAALLLAVADQRIHRLFFQADVRRLRHLGPRAAAP